MAQSSGELKEQVRNLIEYWDFSPQQDEDSRIERLEKQITDIVAARCKQHELDAREDELLRTLPPSEIDYPTDEKEPFYKMAKRLNAYQRDRLAELKAEREQL